MKSLQFNTRSLNSAMPHERDEYTDSQRASRSGPMSLGTTRHGPHPLRQLDSVVSEARVASLARLARVTFAADSGAPGAFGLLARCQEYPAGAPPHIDQVAFPNEQSQKASSDRHET